MKKQLLLLVIMLLPMVALADASGTCGANLTWTYNESLKKLTISGEGEMSDFNYNSTPWNSYKSNIYSVDILDGVTSIGDYAFSSFSSLLNVYFSSTLQEIGEWAFYQCISLKYISIPSNVKTIGACAFQDCSDLISIDEWSGVTTIGSGVFQGCKRLVNFTIPSGMTRIESAAFSNCSKIKDITIPKNIKSIGSSAFNGCTSLTNLIIPNSVTTLEEGAFYNCSGLKSITLSSALNTISNNLFNGCSNLVSITIPNGVISIGALVFKNCSSLISVNIPGSVTTIDHNSFESCSSLTDLIIPEGVQTIGDNAFQSCTGLKTLSLPSSLSSLGYLTFFDCSCLTSVKVYFNTPLSIGYDTFGNQKNCTLYVPIGCKEVFSKAKYWVNFKEFVEFHEGDGTLANPFYPSEAFEYVSGLPADEISNDYFYIEGIISLIKDEYTTTNGYATYYISDDGSDRDDKFYVYRSWFLNNRAFMEGDQQITVGSRVIVYGKVVNYMGSTPEMAQYDNWLVSINGTTAADLPRCERPIIVLEDNKLKLSCATEGVEYHTEITASKNLSSTGTEIELPNTINYQITAYTMKGGYQNSYHTTMNLPQNVGIKGDVNQDGVVTITDAVSVVNIIQNGGGSE